LTIRPFPTPHRFHQVDAAIPHADLHVLGVPSGVRTHHVVEGEHQLLRIEQRRLRVLRALGRRCGFARQRFLQVRARRFRELPAQAAANVRAQAALPRMNALQHRPFVRRPGHAPAEFVRVLQLLEELHGIVDAVHAEIQRVHVPRAQPHRGLATRSERAVRIQRKVRLVFGLAEPAGGKPQEKQHAKRGHGMFLKIFQR
jgi:hypothetical protein